MDFTLVTPNDVDPELLCPLCQSVWDRPVELNPCGDIFCTSCLAVERVRQAQQRPNRPFTCPKCDTDVIDEQQPNRFLINIAEEVQVQCSSCGWKGSRGMSSTHACDGGSGADSAPGSPSNYRSSTPSCGQRVGLEGFDSPPAAATTAAPASASAPPVLRRAPDDSSESVLMRNFETIDNDELEDGAFGRRVFENGGRASSGGGRSGGGHPVASRAPFPPPNPEEPWLHYGMEQGNYDQFMGVFLQFDDAGIHQLDQHQLCDLLKYLNFINNDVDGRMIFAEMDSRHRGVVDFHDLCTWLRQHQPHADALYGLTPTAYTQAILNFRSGDPFVRGVVDWDGFKTICRSSGIANGSEARARQLFAYCDDRQCGFVSLHQYLSLLQLLRSGAAVPTAAVHGTASSHLPSVGSPAGRGGGRSSSSSGNSGTPTQATTSVASPMMGAAGSRQSPTQLAQTPRTPAGTGQTPRSVTGGRATVNHMRNGQQQPQPSPQELPPTALGQGGAPNAGSMASGQHGGKGVRLTAAETGTANNGRGSGAHGGSSNDECTVM